MTVAPQTHWPAEPYKGLSFYRPEDRPLFAGRDEDIQSCAAVLASYGTRTLILHGQTGCGKSSFLRAGLIPTMEHEGVGFEFLKDQDNEFQTIFIRCTHAPLTQIANQLYQFAESGYSFRTPSGEMTIDLRSALGGAETPQKFRLRCRDGDALTEVLMSFSSLLPCTLVLVIDQAEEVITLSSPERERDRKDSDNFFAFLQKFNSISIDLKLIIALRTEFYGRFFSKMQSDYAARADVKQFFLEDLVMENLVDAIERPTLKRGVGDFGVPHDTYGFEYEPGLARQIAQDIFKAREGGGVLPLLQIVCRSLYIDARASDERPMLVTRDDYVRMGRVEGRIAEHVRKSIEDACRSQALPESRLETEVNRWRRALCVLASRQEDGSATTRVTQRAHLRDAAAAQAVTADKDQVLDVLSAPDRLVLRPVWLLNEATGEKMECFSLGHDTIGLSLLQWRDREEEAKKRRSAVRSSRISQWITLAAVVFASIGTVLNFYFRHVERRALAVEKAERLVLAARSVSAGDYPLGLLLTLEALNVVEGEDGILVTPGPADQLISILAGAPHKWQKLDAVAPQLAPVQLSRDAVIYSTGNGAKLLHLSTGSEEPIEFPQLDEALPDWDKSEITAWFGSDGNEVLFVSDTSLYLAEENRWISIVDFVARFGKSTEFKDRRFYPHGSGVLLTVNDSMSPDNPSEFTGYRWSPNSDQPYAYIGSETFEDRLAIKGVGSKIIFASAEWGSAVQGPIEFGVVDLKLGLVAVFPAEARKPPVISPDGRYLVVTAGPSRIRVYDLTLDTGSGNGSCSPPGCLPYKEPDGVFEELAVANSMRVPLVAALLEQAGVQLLSAESGVLTSERLLGVRPRTRQFVEAFSFTPGGDFLVLVSMNDDFEYFLQYWDLRKTADETKQSLSSLSETELRDRACTAAGRNLTQEEWRQHLGTGTRSPTCPAFPPPQIRASNEEAPGA
ncbi:MAG: ATP-binding protein [Planctomycetota bacterium]|nr:ATP-binding protein [Planctomycetota bacterium]